MINQFITVKRLMIIVSSINSPMHVLRVKQLIINVNASADRIANAGKRAPKMATKEISRDKTSPPINPYVDLKIIPIDLLIDQKTIILHKLIAAKNNTVLIE